MPEALTGRFGRKIYPVPLLSDDGSTLSIDGHTIIDNDGEHSPKEVVGQVALEKGLRSVRILYFDRNGGMLRLNLTDR